MRRSLLVLLVVVLLLGAVNVAVGVRLMARFGTRWPGTVGIINEIGPGAAMYPLPFRPPHQRPWPPATQYSIDRAFGRTRIGTWHADSANQTTHQMMVEWYGWPLPVLRHAQLWWPLQDPAWATSAHQDQGLELCWSGFLLNPLIVGIPIWGFLMVPAGVRAITRRRRRRAGRCAGCGYPVGISERCTECGASVTAPTPVPQSFVASHP